MSISRAEVSTAIQEAYSDTLLAAAVAGSTVLTAFPTVNLGTKLTHLPVLATLPEAGWVTESADSTGVKRSSVTLPGRSSNTGRRRMPTASCAGWPACAAL